MYLFNDSATLRAIMKGLPVNVSMNIKTKMALSMSALFLFFFGAFAIIILFYFHGQLQTMIADHQFQTLSVIAADIDDDIVNARMVIKELARAIPPHHVSDPVRLQQALDFVTKQNYFSSIFFDTGIFIDSQGGRLIAETPLHPERFGMDVSTREYFLRTIKTKSPAVSKPYITTYPSHDIVVTMTAPLLDEDGKIAAILGGRTSLIRKNFLGRITDIRVGSTGYLFLFDADRTIILHPDRSKIMASSAADRTTAFMEKAIAGFEGSMEIVSPEGISMLASVKKLRRTGWYLAAYYPTREAYASIISARTYSLSLMTTGIVLTIFFSWLFMRWQLLPLMSLTGQIRTISADFLQQGMVTVPRTKDEVADLGNAFNEMLARLQEWGRLVEETNIQLASAHAFTRNLIDSSLDMIIAVNNDRLITEFNRAAEEAFGYHQNEVLGQHVRMLYHTSEEGARVGKMVREQHTFTGEIINLKKSGETFPAFLSASCIYNSRGDMIGVMGISRDITAQKRAEEELRRVHKLLEQRANTDTLTGLFNRLKFDEMLETEMTRAQRYGTPLSLIMFDLDHFKTVNDTYGHHTGDVVLKNISRLVTEHIRLHDVLARWGGEEFMILVPNSTGEQARQLAEKMRELISRTVLQPGASITCSFGVTELTPADTFESFTKRVDVALYRAKERGRNRVEDAG